MHPSPAGTITFLFTDIEGSTRKWEQFPQIMRQALAHHDQLLRQVITDHHGSVFKTVGDAFCAAFPTPADAVAAVIQAQVGLQSQPWPDIGPLRIRVGIHTGDAEQRDDDYFGPTLNRVARLQGIGHGGQTLLSQAAAALLQDSMPVDASLRDLGSHRLKDLGQPEHVWQLCLSGENNEFPPVRSLQAFANNLPLQMTSFVGRDQEMAQVKELLSTHRLVTLTGAGGSGKTRLALQVSADRIEQYGDGVWLVELAALADPGLVPQAVATVLGVREEPGRTLTDALVDYLRSKKTLLVLDNCEHLMDACASLAQTLLTACPGVQVLATSREALNIPGEQPWRVPALSQPHPDHLPLREKEIGAILLGYDAVRLFVDRARTHRPQFVLSRGNAEPVARICHRLDGIPLAIELAAARVRAMPVEEITNRLDDRFRLLTAGSRTALPRQQTLRALIDWSYDLLTGPEQALLCRLSVFAGGWTLSAAESVCAGDGIEDWEVSDLLLSLVDKSLVVYDDETDRYRLLETVRQYAGDRLAEGGGSAGVQERSASWFLGLAEAGEPQLTGPEQAQWLERLETEHDNLRASLFWYEKTPEKAENGLRLAGALWRFWSVRGYLSEGRQWLGRALESAKTGAEAGTASVFRAKALNGAGLLAWRQGDYGAAQAFHEESLEIKRQLGDQLGIANSLTNLGLIACDQGDYGAARALHDESLEISRRLGDQQSIAVSLNNLGNVADSQGDYGAAQAFHEESLEIRRRLGDQRGIALSLFNLGNVAYFQGDYGAARALYEESLEIRRQLGDQWGIAGSLGNLGNVVRDQGDYGAARALHEESLKIRRRLEDQRGIAHNCEGLAGVAHGQKQLSRATCLWGAASSLRVAISNPLSPTEQKEFDELVASARAALGGEAFSAAWDAGWAMTLEQAIEYALSGAE